MAGLRSAIGDLLQDLTSAPYFSVFFHQIYPHTQPDDRVLGISAHFSDRRRTHDSVLFTPRICSAIHSFENELDDREWSPSS